MRHCECCRKFFASAQMRINHACTKRSKPDWMSPMMYNSSFRKTDSSKTCLGCRMVFPATSGRWSFEHLIHMIEDCLEYKILNLIKECHECHYKFPNKTSLHKHVTVTHFPIEKSLWMTDPVYKWSRVVADGRCTPSPCRGCGKVMKARNGSYRTEDYVHMIEECEKYKELGLIRTCNKCDCKFIDPSSLKGHKCWCSCKKHK